MSVLTRPAPSDLSKLVGMRFSNPKAKNQKYTTRVVVGVRSGAFDGSHGIGTWIVDWTAPDGTAHTSPASSFRQWLRNAKRETP